MSFDLTTFTLLGQAESATAAPDMEDWPWLDVLFPVLHNHPTLGVLLRVLLAIPVPIILGYLVANWLRMRDYGWKLALIFFSVMASAVIIESGKLNLGVDLKGGVILIYEVDQEALRPEGGAAPAATDVDWPGLLERISDRINPAGLQEIVVRRYGDWQIEIIVPEVNPIEVKRIKDLISTAGSLEFRIVANPRAHADVIRLAEQQALDPDRQQSRFVLSDHEVDKKTGKKKVVAYWARVAREKTEDKQQRGTLRVDVSDYTIRNAATGELIRLPADFDRQRKHGLDAYLKQQKIDDIDVLMYTNDGLDVAGKHLSMTTRGFDEKLQPCINFVMKAQGAGLMGGLTASALPDKDTEYYQLLGIMLDGELLSAPRVMDRISDHGRITGRFTNEEVDFLVGILQAGSLPAAIQKVPIHENQIGAILGGDTIRKGTTATWASLAIVIVFMMAWYRLSGIVASIAVGLNLVLILAMMMAVHAALTLPGLAGMVLTVGMAVDSNVLIFERMREELERGAALRMAIRNGFDRAFSAIFDSNLTTVLTALVLYAIGTDQLKGFAVTLTLGLGASMFTAVFCSHVAFDILERKRLIAGLKMRHIPVPSFDFVKQCKKWVGISAVVILIGLAASAYRGARLFGIDFTGGTSVTMLVATETNETAIRDKMDDAFATLEEQTGVKEEYTVNHMVVQGQEPGTVWKIDSTLEKVETLKAALKDKFALARYSMTFADVQETRTAVKVTPPPADKPAPSKASTSRTDLPPDTMLALADGAAPPAGGTDADKPKPAPAEAKAPETVKPPADEPKAAAEKTDGKKVGSETQPTEGKKVGSETQPTETKTTEPAPKDAKTAGTKDVTAEKPEPAQPAAKTAPVAEKPAGQKPAPAKSTAEKPSAEPVVKERVTTSATLDFTHDINGLTLQAKIVAAAEAAGVALSPDQVKLRIRENNPDWRLEHKKGYRLWSTTLTAGEENARTVLLKLKEQLNDEPVWPSASEIGTKVAGDARTFAVVALVASWLGIIAYIWFRFQNAIWGVAAVVALVHDVLVTLTAIAISYWATRVLGFLLVDEFKIGLSEIAAFLTIIGYSVNDTIVTFDRLREIRGKNPDITPKMINDAVNQTLSRTILTAVTVFLVVLLLYAFGGEGIHGFAYAMLIGTVVGCYSTVFIAAPIVLWMLPKPKKPGEQA